MIDENVGRILAQKYELVRLLGRGGMGAVYEGRNQIGKRVAIKLLLKPELATNGTLTTRFFREAQASAAVESRHVVDVYDTGVDPATGIPYIIMAFLSGEDLEQLRERLGPLNPVAAVRIVSQAAMGLAKAHEAGIVHRDIKPANLFLASEDGESIVKILDFGIAKLGLASDAGAADASALTETGALLGTPFYMSPEQAQGLKNVDARTDVWSLGMCLYHLLAGRLPFGDVDTIGKLIVAIVAHELPPVLTLAPWVPPDLAAVVQRTLERDVGKRFASARDLITALAPFTSGKLSLTPDIVVSVRGTLDATLLPGSLTAASAFPSGHSLPSTGATASFPGERLAPTKRASRAIPIGIAVVVVAAAVAAALGRGSHGAPPSASPEKATALPAPLAPSAETPADDIKVGTLALKMPEGFAVKVDGFSPGSPEAQGASRLRDDGTLELRGEFQRKFLVAVYDKAGKRVMVQDVYLYDNRLDPSVIDPTVGIVAVDKPRHHAASAPSAPPTAPHSAATGDLPARF